jgi:hypothetical protein
MVEQKMISNVLHMARVMACTTTINASASNNLTLLFIRNKVFLQFYNYVCMEPHCFNDGYGTGYFAPASL